MSQFDALLDFGDSTPTANGTVQKTDDFDPFQASPTIDMKGATSGDLLGDFSFDGQVSQSNGTHNNETDVLTGFSSPSNNINPLYDLINTDLEPDVTPASDSSVAPSSNPLYEMSTDYEETQKPDMASSDNPMYGYLSSEENTNGSPSEDLMGTSATVTSDDSGVTMETAQTSEEELIMVSGEKSVVENGEKNCENVNVVNGDTSSYQEEVVCDQGEIIENDVLEEVTPQEDVATLQSVGQEAPEEGVGNSAESSGELEEKPLNEEQGEEIVEEISMDAFMQSSQTEAGEQEPEEDRNQVEEVDIPEKEDQVIEPVQTEVIETQPELVQTEEPQVPEPVSEPEVCLEPEPVENEPEQEERYIEEEVIQGVQEDVLNVAPQVQEEEETTQIQEEEQQPQPQEEEVSQITEEEVAPQPQEEEVPQIMEEEVPPQPQEEEVAPQPQEEEVPQFTEEEVAPQPQEEEVTQITEEEVAPQPQEEEVAPQPQEEEVAPQPEQEEMAPQEVQSVTEDQQEIDQVTYKSTSFICLSPISPQSPPISVFTYNEDDQFEEVVTEQKDNKTVTTKTQETTTTKQEDSGPAVTTTSKSSSEVVENGLNDAKENQEEIRFDDMADIKNKFEAGDNQVITSSGKVNVHEEILNVQSGEFENEPEKFEQWQNQTEGGVYENQPQENPDVFKESQKNVGEELPEVGMAKNVLEKFKKIQEDGYTPEKKKEPTPDKSVKYEYVSEPRSVMEKPKEVVEAGVFESQPTEPEDIVRSTDHLEEALPEQGSAKNLLAKFKKIENEVGNRPPPSPGQRELTPDRNTKGEYVSEPRTQFQQYQGKVESGEFESHPEEVEDIVKSGNSIQEVLPEKGTAVNLVSKFKQYQSESSSPPSPRQKKELTPDRSGKVEYVSEPRGQIEVYEGKSEAGIFESSPVDQPEIVKSGDFQPELLPEEGYAKNVAARFKELEKSGGSSPTGTPQRHKEFTPPREDTNQTVAGVLENQPESLDIAKESDSRFKEDELPERGMAKNVLNRFKEIQANSPTSPRNKKEFTPPPDHASGVFENKPAPSLEIDVRQAESGILESSPVHREDVAKEHVQAEETVPEQGYAKNMVNRWKQMETESAKSSPSPKYKEFTPPRDNLMSPKSPAGLNSSVNPNDLPGQYQEQVSAGIYENTPEQKEGIFREADTDYEAGLPAKDTTRALLQRFNSIQSQAKEAQETPKPISRKDSVENGNSPAPEIKKMFEQEESAIGTLRDHNDGNRGEGNLGEGYQGKCDPDDQLIRDQDSQAQQTDSLQEAKKPSFVPVLDKCAACGKTVYALEKMEVNKSLYHRACVRCSHCKAVVTSKNMSVNEGVIFCTPHFKQLFARRGNYDEGFGRKQYKKKWGEQNGETS